MGGFPGCFQRNSQLVKHQEGGGEAHASLNRAQNFRDEGPKEERWSQIGGEGLTKGVWAAWGVRQGRNVCGEV